MTGKSQLNLKDVGHPVKESSLAVHDTGDDVSHLSDTESSDEEIDDNPAFEGLVLSERECDFLTSVVADHGPDSEEAVSWFRDNFNLRHLQPPLSSLFKKRKRVIPRQGPNDIFQTNLAVSSPNAAQQSSVPGNQGYNNAKGPGREKGSKSGSTMLEVMPDRGGGLAVPLSNRTDISSASTNRSLNHAQSQILLGQSLASLTSSSQGPNSVVAPGGPPGGMSPFGMSVDGQSFEEDSSNISKNKYNRHLEDAQWRDTAYADLFLSSFCTSISFGLTTYQCAVWATLFKQTHDDFLRWCRKYASVGGTGTRDKDLAKICMDIFREHVTDLVENHPHVFDKYELKKLMDEFINSYVQHARLIGFTFSQPQEVTMLREIRPIEVYPPPTSLMNPRVSSSSSPSLLASSPVLVTTPGFIPLASGIPLEKWEDFCKAEEEKARLERIAREEAEHVARVKEEADEKARKEAAKVASLNDSILTAEKHLVSPFPEFPESTRPSLQKPSLDQVFRKPLLDVLPPIQCQSASPLQTVKEAIGFIHRVPSALMKPVSAGGVSESPSIVLTETGAGMPPLNMAKREMTPQMDLSGSMSKKHSTLLTPTGEGASGTSGSTGPGGDPISPGSKRRGSFIPSVRKVMASLTVMGDKPGTAGDATKPGSASANGPTLHPNPHVTEALATTILSSPLAPLSQVTDPTSQTDTLPPSEKLNRSDMTAALALSPYTRNLNEIVDQFSSRLGFQTNEFLARMEKLEAAVQAREDYKQSKMKRQSVAAVTALGAGSGVPGVTGRVPSGKDRMASPAGPNGKPKRGLHSAQVGK